MFVNREAAVGSASKLKRRVVEVARQSQRDAKRRVSFQRSVVYEFPIPTGYQPRTLVIEMADVKPKSYLVLPEEPFSFWKDRLGYSELLERDYRYLGSGHTEILLGDSAAKGPIRARIVPWGNSGKKLPEAIYVTLVRSTPSPLGQRSRLVIGQKV